VGGVRPMSRDDVQDFFLRYRAAFEDLGAMQRAPR
jgi:hypothetical protein